MKLSIVIPAHNEQHRLAPTLESYCAFFDKYLSGNYEIIVVVNHCTDSTELVARQAAETFSSILIEAETAYVGKGGAVLMGFQAASGEYIGFVDADGATPADSFFQLLEKIGDAGCAIGSRWVEGAQVNPKQSLMRRFASRLLNRVIVHGFFDLQVHDSQCGAKLFTREVLLPLLPELKEKGWAFDIDLLCRVKRCGYGIREIPVEWHHVPGNPINFIVMSAQMLASVWRVKRAL
ncbi:glycosyltransferase [Pontiellaceae bacterium B1224]|nr:glycosyltransferase [Pontiellaceae bacterium B1224]